MTADQKTISGYRHYNSTSFFPACPQYTIAMTVLANIDTFIVNISLPLLSGTCKCYPHAFQPSSESMHGCTPGSGKRPMGDSGKTRPALVSHAAPAMPPKIEKGLAAPKHPTRGIKTDSILQHRFSSIKEKHGVQTVSNILPPGVQVSFLSSS